MKKKTSLKRARHKQRRLSPDDRRKEFVAKATEFFAEQGYIGFLWNFTGAFFWSATPLAATRKASG
jgi:hypothetical protein